MPRSIVPSTKLTDKGMFMKIVRILAAAICGLPLLSMPAQADAITAFSYSSALSSWVGNGWSRILTPSDGLNFAAYHSTSDNWLYFAIDDVGVTNYGPLSSQWWDLTFRASTPLTIGTYRAASDYSLVPVQGPILDIDGNGEGNGGYTGQFSILEASYGTNGAVLAFAADFVMYEDGNTSQWFDGSLRYNSSIPLAGQTASVPEPTTLSLFLAGALSLIGVLAWRRRPAK
jgi:hypothetical protein